MNHLQPTRNANGFLRLPMCGQCGTKVERIGSFTNHLRDAVTFIAHCHGENQVVDIGSYLLVNGKVEFTTAFTQPKKLTNE